jgi:hypothetical protein
MKQGLKQDLNVLTNRMPILESNLRMWSLRGDEKKVVELPPRNHSEYLRYM